VSFGMAATLLGASVHGIDSHENAPDAESPADRIQVLNAYPSDFLLLRYHEEGGASRAVAVSRMPVINAGDGLVAPDAGAARRVHALARTGEPG
jgi:aspartate carbamoyltransferase catalytic subunit